MIAMSGVRKEIGLGCSIAFLLFYLDKKYIWALAALLVGTTIHMTTLLILLVPLVALFRPQIIKAYHIIALLLIPAVVVFSSQLLIYMGGVVGNEKYQEFGKGPAGGGAGTFFFLIEVLSVLCLLAFNKKAIK